MIHNIIDYVFTAFPPMLFNIKQPKPYLCKSLQTKITLNVIKREKSGGSHHRLLENAILKPVPEKPYYDNRIAYHGRIWLERNCRVFEGCEEVCSRLGVRFLVALWAFTFLI